MSLFFYNLFIALYGFAARIISPWNPKAKHWLQGRKGLFNKAGDTDPRKSWLSDLRNPAWSGYIAPRWENLSRETGD